MKRVWARPRHCANPALQLKLSLKKTAKGTILSPSKFRGKNSKGSTHEEIYFSTEIASWNRTWKVYFIAPLKFILKSHFSHALLNMYVSCSTKRGERARQLLTCHIENVFEHKNAFTLQIKARVNQRKMIQKIRTVYKSGRNGWGSQETKKITRSHVVALWKGGDVLLFLSEI